MFDFTITGRSATGARRGIFTTPRGSFETPCFMPCGTKGTVKALAPDDLKKLGCEIILANTYHLFVRPGGGLLQTVGGLHRWMAWDRPILTDSGGYQVFSLAGRRTISEEGVRFQSHIDGAEFLMTPELATATQEQIGADIIMAFDECPPPGAEKDYVRQSMERTHRWLARCKKSATRSDQALFPIIQGGVFPDLRRQSGQFCVSTESKGYAIGGVAVGEPKPDIWKVLETVAPLLPENKPRYVMGLGDPSDIMRAVGYGMDMFDCVLPTRLARHGSFWVWVEGVCERIDITKAEFRTDRSPLSKDCACSTCALFSKSYLRHLFVEKELLVYRLLSIHNLHFLLDLMRRIRNDCSS